MRQGQVARINFSAGELSPLMAGRIDLELYQNGAERLENCVVMPQGGITKAPGTRFLRAAKTSFQSVRLMPFYYDNEHAYMLEFGHYYLRIHDQDGEEHATIESTPWEGGDVFAIQAAGVETWRVIVCRGVKPALLTYNPNGKSFSLNQDITWTPYPVEGGDDIDFNHPDNHPSVCAFYQERLILAGLPSRPSVIYGSQVGEPFNFSDSAPDLIQSDAYSHEFASQDAAPVLWINAYGQLIIATATEEFTWDNPSPLSVMNIRSQSSYGAAPIPGRVAGAGVMFFQRYGRRLNEYTYADRESPYRGEDLTLLAPHIFGEGVIQMATMNDPWLMLWAVKKDGSMVCLTREQNAGVHAFTRHSTVGHYESVATLPGRNSDQLWVVVRREAGGEQLRYIERMETFDPVPLEDSIFMHSVIDRITGDTTSVVTAVPYIDPLTITIEDNPYSEGNFLRLDGIDVYLVESVDGDTLVMGYTDGSGEAVLEEQITYESAVEVHFEVEGLAHLEGQDVDVLVDGGRHEQTKVEDGKIELERWSKNTKVGLPYLALFQSMPGAIGDVTRFTKVSARFYHTVGCLWGSTEDRMREVLWLEHDKDPFVGPAPIYTGDKKDLFPGDTRTTQTIVAGNNYPLPWTLLGIVVDATMSKEV